MYETGKIRVNFERWEKQVQMRESKENKEGQVVFYGSSYFTLWNSEYANIPLVKALLNKKGEQVCINQAFGGSTVEEQLFFYDRLIKPLKPRAIVFTGFINDFTRGYNSDEVIFLFKRFLEYARYDIPGVKFYLCDIHTMKKYKGMSEGDGWRVYRNTINDFLKEYCESHDDCTFICQRECPYFFESEEATGDYSKIRTDIFLEDGLHFTKEGYDLVIKFFRERLEDLLNE